MKEYRLMQHGTGMRPTLVESPVRAPGPAEVRVRVAAASLNYRDLDELDRSRADGLIPLSDAVGEVDAVGGEVTRWHIGDRVAANFFPNWTHGPFQRHYLDTLLGGGKTNGVLAESIVLPASALVAVPDHLSDEEAATLPCAGLTAWRALTEGGVLTADDTVLVQGTGGVAIYGLQLARAMGARVIVLSSSDDKLERAKALGAAITINYRTTPEWDKLVQEQTGGRGASRLLELGGPSTFQRSIRSIAAGGRIAMIGALAGDGPLLDISRLHGMNASIFGLTVGSVEQFDAMNAFVSAKRLRPAIDKVFAFDQVPAAYSHLRSGAHFGKVVVRVA